MTAGVPGAGIGTLFYLISALWMPFEEIRRGVQGRSTPASRRTVLRQSSIALGMCASLWGVAWALSIAIAPLVHFLQAHGWISPAPGLPRILSYWAFALSAATLVGIVVVVQALCLFVTPTTAPLRAKPARSSVG